MDIDRWIEDLKAHGLEHLLENVDTLSPLEKNSFFAQLQKQGLELFIKQRNFIKTRRVHLDLSTYIPVEVYEERQDTEEEKKGLFALQHGEIACLILAGGQGTRLACTSHKFCSKTRQTVVPDGPKFFDGKVCKPCQENILRPDGMTDVGNCPEVCEKCRLGLKGPKGTLPITNIYNKTLFEYFFEKIKAATALAKTHLKVAIMTSPLNHKETLIYLKENHFFGLNPNDIEIFIQSCLPILNDQKNWFLEKPGKLAISPDGNGYALEELFASGIGGKWQKEGVKYINVIPVDNPLADPFDYKMIGHQKNVEADLCIKSILREETDEELGVLARKNGKLHVIEYTELDDKQKRMRDQDGGLYFKNAYAGLFSVHMDFIDTILREAPLLRWHLARKKSWENNKQIDVWKFETFVFDLFPLAQKPEVIVAPREECFAPVKKPTDVEKTKTALQIFDKRSFSKVSGLPPPDRLFELDPSFYYPSQDLLDKWRGKNLPEGDYISPT